MILIKCNKCGQYKDETHFYKRRYSNYYEGLCKECGKKVKYESRMRILKKKEETFNKTVPDIWEYEGREYKFVKKIKENLYLYEDKLGFKICFDKFELNMLKNEKIKK